MPADVIGEAWRALGLLLEPTRLSVLVAGVIIGLGIGILPGLSGVVGLALLIPFTYHLDPPTAFALLLGMAAVITSSDFVTAVLFGVPGHVGAAATVIDGHAMARKGEAGRAFGAGFAASLAGGLVGAVVLGVSVPVLRPLLLGIGSPELLAFSIFGLSMVATLSGRAPLKGLAAAALGLMLSMIGSRAEGGTLRWTFDALYLWDGVPLVPVVLGLFALPELAELAVTRQRIAGEHAADITLSSQWQGVRDVVKHWRLVLRCSLLGTALGAIPGVGSAVIDWIAYGYAQRTERNSETFGTGDVRGVIAPESSNNAKEGGHLVPTIAFGVPAGASMAVLLGAFLMHGLQPGPDMLTKHLDLTYTIVWSLTLAHVIGALICLSGSRWLAQISRIRPEILLPIVLAFVFVAAYQGSHDWGDLYTLLLFGIIGWLMKYFGWPRPPLVLGLVIGGLFERYLFISTELYGLGWLWRPVVLIILAIVVWALYRPLSKLAFDVVAQLRSVGVRQFRMSAAAVFTLAVIALVITALVSALDWPTPARLVPLTACVIALVTTALNLVYEVLGPEPAGPAPSETATPRVIAYFGWLVMFLALIAIIGFIPAICVFIFSYMRWGFRESWISSLGYGAATGLVCWLVFDLALHAVWPRSLLGDLLPDLSASSGLI
jgi:TctA family transporter